MNEIFFEKQNKILKKKFNSLSKLIRISTPEIIKNYKKYILLSKESKFLDKIINYYNNLKKNKTNIKEIENLLKKDSDKELLELAFLEKKNLFLEKKKILNKIENLLKKKNYNKILMELRAGTGGDEACIFVEDIFRMYTLYFKELGWKYDILNMQQGSIKGYKEIILEIEGKNVYDKLKFESGVHRVQRIPYTESQGRLHTSAITVAVIPENYYKNNIKIVLSDLKRETFKASGAGGQHVNKTESAIRLTHIPTGIVAECQEERSQHKNYEKAIKVLRARIYNSEFKKKNELLSKKRKSLISTGERSEKIRTYNYPQGRVTDHRINKSIYYLDHFMNGKLNEMITALKILEK
ncbi:peptide chain release factor 1 [Candidatus Karelsulcia muelleri]|uniref:peptide chain release factor 1 n=1 Tax=Candidatus Karelsulcia muelleri TaxID=336810 RepID=UPI000D7BF6BC|nr:peptide chain release factor 1 [Candidatus Karelsulcia muelleri]